MLFLVHCKICLWASLGKVSKYIPHCFNSVIHCHTELTKQSAAYHERWCENWAAEVLFWRKLSNPTGHLCGVEYPEHTICSHLEKLPDRFSINPILETQISILIVSVSSRQYICSRISWLLIWYIHLYHWNNILAFSIFGFLMGKKWKDEDHES